MPYAHQISPEDPEDNNSRLTSCAVSRNRVLHFVHHHYVHNALLGLLILDVIFVITGLLLEIIYLDSKVQTLKKHLYAAEKQDGANCSYLHNNVGRMYSQAGDQDVHNAEVTLVWCSVGVLSFFVIEGLMLMYGMGLAFFKSPYHLFDYFVVLVSFTLEIVVSQNKSMIGLIMFGRFWRFMRIAHGVETSGVESHKIVEGKKQKEEKIMKTKTMISKQWLRNGGADDEEKIERPATAASQNMPLEELAESSLVKES